MFNYIVLTVGILGGLLLIIGSIKSMPLAPGWSKIAVRIAGSSAIIWAILKIIQISHIVINNTVAGRLLQSSKTFIGGICVGILITLFISGELRFKKTKT